MRRRKKSPPSNFSRTFRVLRTICAHNSHSSAKIAPTNHLVSIFYAHIKRVRISLKNSHIKSLCFHTHAHTFPGNPVDSAFYELGTGGVVGIEQNEAPKI